MTEGRSSRSEHPGALAQAIAAAKAEARATGLTDADIDAEQCGQPLAAEGITPTDRITAGGGGPRDGA